MCVGLALGKLFLIFFFFGSLLFSLQILEMFDPIDRVEAKQMVINVILDDFRDRIVVQQICQNHHAEILVREQR